MIRHHSHFQPNGTNANFVKVLAPDHIAIRTYERGFQKTAPNHFTAVTLTGPADFVFDGEIDL